MSGWQLLNEAIWRFFVAINIVLLWLHVWGVR